MSSPGNFHHCDIEEWNSFHQYTYLEVHNCRYTAYGIPFDHTSIVAKASSMWVPLKLLLHRTQQFRAWVLQFCYSRQQNYSRTWGNSCQKNSYLMQFHEINISQVMIFRLYVVYNKHEMIKNEYQTWEKSQASEVLE